MARVVLAGPRRWLGYGALVVVFAVVCGLLSWWQFARNEEAAERIRQVADNWDAAPVPLGEVLASPSDPFDPADTWTPVRMTGEYDTANQLLVRGRPRDGRPGFEVLVPFVPDDGRGVLVVDRGWVPVGETQGEVPDFVPPAPRGPITVVARLKAGEPSVPGRSAPEGQVATIELPLIASITGLDVFTSAYGVLDSEPGSTLSAAPARASRPEPDPGPHLSYAVQWILFAIFAAAALVWAIRNERLQADPDYVPKPRRAKIGEGDAAEEDALLDGPSTR
ncbi:MAG: SURF1 family protein [Microbacteriaceae bacterium]|nr:SURF1 family protein [Microbacteriaceae bacterium]